MKEKDKDWITIFPDWPMAFAWHLTSCDESKLTEYVGPCHGDVLGEDDAYCGEYTLPKELSRKLYDWMKRWQAFDKRIVADGEGYVPDWETEYAVDMEGIEMAKMIKEIVGEKYRVRYSRCYGFANDGYPRDRAPFCGKDWVLV